MNGTAAGRQKGWWRMEVSHNQPKTAVIKGIVINRKRVLEGTFFLLVMVLSFYTVFRGQDMRQIRLAMARLSPAALLMAMATALFFVSAEGIMIHYLLRSLNGRSSLRRCIVYSFIGFFYSGITPSATGGQPMQLYYMTKDHNSMSGSSVVLMTVALLYKLVLVLIGIATLVFWHRPLRIFLKEYYPLFLLGLALNTILVALLLAVMLAPKSMKRILSGIEKLLVRVRILKPSRKRREKIGQFVEGYRGAVRFLLDHKGKVFAVGLFTLVQRASVFVLTWIIYLGFSLKGTDGFSIMLLQASVYIAVDMLPVPGAQGITEMMYRSVFGSIFKGEYLMPSLYVTRGINFYFVLLVSLGVVIINHFFIRRKDRRSAADRN